MPYYAEGQHRAHILINRAAGDVPYWLERSRKSRRRISTCLFQVGKRAFLDGFLSVLEAYAQESSRQVPNTPASLELVVARRGASQTAAVNDAGPHSALGRTGARYLVQSGPSLRRATQSNADPSYHVSARLFAALANPVDEAGPRSAADAPAKKIVRKLPRFATRVRRNAQAPVQPPQRQPAAASRNSSVPSLCPRCAQTASFRALG